jgi:hypothetical protein
MTYKILNKNNNIFSEQEVLIRSNHLTDETKYHEKHGVQSCPVAIGFNITVACTKGQVRQYDDKASRDIV